MLTATDHTGIQTGISAEGVQVVRIHYSADPLKDPATPAGEKWMEKELQGYRGTTDPRWRKEMEIDFDAHGGQLLFPYLLENEARLFVPPVDVKGMPVIAGMDYGTRNPSAFEVLSVDYDGHIRVVWEYYEIPKTKNETDEQFRSRKGYKALSAAIKACPYFSKTLIIWADPSLWAKTQETEDPKNLRSVADLFAQEKVFLSPGQRGRDFACYEKLDSKIWADPKAPQLTIMRNCPWLWWEIQRLRFADFGAATQATRNLQEKIVDKDNHGWDAFKYAVMTLPAFTKKPKKIKSLAEMRIDYLEKGAKEDQEYAVWGQDQRNYDNQFSHDFNEAFGVPSERARDYIPTVD